MALGLHLLIAAQARPSGPAPITRSVPPAGPTPALTDLQTAPATDLQTAPATCPDDTLCDPVACPPGSASGADSMAETDPIAGLDQPACVASEP